MAPIIFRIKPVLAISIIINLPVPKIIAFGGVATGSIKAMEADRVAGSMNNSGLTSADTDMPASIGRIISVVAVLEVSSVRNVIVNEIVKIMINGWAVSISAKC